MKKNIEYIFISNGYKGGNITFLIDHIEYLSKLKKKIILIDDDPSVTYGKISKLEEVKKN